MTVLQMNENYQNLVSKFKTTSTSSKNRGSSVNFFNKNTKSANITPIKNVNIIHHIRVPYDLSVDKSKEY